VDDGPQGDVIGQLGARNDIAMRRTDVARPECVSARDRYEYNDREATTARLVERWDFLGNRCTREITRALGEPYPDTECLHVFEDARVPVITPSRSAEQIWSLVVPDLSLHSREDEDYFALALPDLADRRWGLHNIHPEGVRVRGALQDDYEPEVMPECGSVQRQAFGPTGRDNTIYVNISTELVITARPVANAVADEPADLSGERVRMLDVPAPEGAGSSLSRVTSCPRAVHGLEEVRFALERVVMEGAEDPRRSLDATGGYEIEVSYLSTARRGIPDWARDVNDGQGLRPLPCLPVQIGPGVGPGFAGLPGNLSRLPGGFPGTMGAGFGPCLSIPGLLRPGLLLPHPRTPRLPGCIADGPGCRELSYFDLAANERFRVFNLFSEKVLSVSILDQSGRVVARATSLPVELMNSDQVPVQQAPKGPQHVLDLSNLAEGSYFMQVDGPSSDLYLLPARAGVPGLKRN